MKEVPVMSVTSILEYINLLDNRQQEYLNNFIDFMEINFPQYKPKICFSMPMWLINKKMRDGYIAFSAAKNHFSIHFSDEKFLHELSQSLPACKSGKRCINIKYGDDESYQMVKEHVKNFLNQQLSNKL